jgi:hypothetical protein
MHILKNHQTYYNLASSFFLDYLAYSDLPTFCMCYCLRSYVTTFFLSPDNQVTFGLHNGSNLVSSTPTSQEC